jgi:hypothetical protein
VFGDVLRWMEDDASMRRATQQIMMSDGNRGGGNGVRSEFRYDKDCPRAVMMAVDLRCATRLREV